MNISQPLDEVSSIKVKLALLVGASIIAASLVSEIGDRAGVPVWITVPVTVAAALGVTQWLARGMTSPLREMTVAAEAMATGDYTRRVQTTSSDEVGELALAFNTMASDLATADQQRRQLVATVSHELRTPLTAQQALLENLVDGVVHPDDDVLRAALAQAERLGALVEDLLDLSRLDGGRARLRLEAVEVRPLVERCVAEANVVGRLVRHEIDVPSSLVVTADPARLAQVLTNLLDNAGRHSPSGGVVAVRAGELEGGRWFLEVTDQGPGIPADRADRVFERFGTWDESAGGTGIGLAIASWVCELHGGSIGVLPGPERSQPEGSQPDGAAPGAKVRAILPVRPTPPEPTPRPAMPPTVEQLAPSPSRTGSRPTEETPVSIAQPPAGPVAGPDTVRPAVAPRPLVESIFGDFWPEAGLSPRPRLLLGSLGIGLLAAAVLPERDLGLGVLLVLVTAGVLVVTASARRRRPWTLLSVAVCLGLASLVVLRAAEWLAVLSIPLVGLVVASALTGARALPSMLAAGAAWVLSGLRGLPLLGRTLAALSRWTLVWPVLRTAAITLVALVVFGGLFASGDAVFGSWVSALIPDLAWDSLIQRAFVLFFVGGIVLAACYLAINPPRVDRVALPPAAPVQRMWEWLVPIGVVLALFAGFIVAQAAAMFGGRDYLLRTTGLTYAEYVHQGFGQLTVATVLTLVMVAITVRKARREAPRDRLVLRLVLGALCVLTLLVVASALHRMDLYQQAYGFTVLRLLVVAFELWLGLLVLLVLAAGIRLSGWWLPRVALVSAAVFVLALGWLSPEAWVAGRNIDRYHATGKLDVHYLSTLGADAAPTVVAGLPRNVAACIVSSQGLPREDDVLEWNLGRARAASLGTDPLPGFDQSECSTLLRTGLAP